MGFKLPYISVDPSGNTATAILDLNGPKYLILVLDDYNQNHVNNSIVSITQLSNKLKIPSYYSPDIPYTCVGPTQSNLSQLINGTNAQNGLLIAGKFENDFDLNYSFSRGKLEDFEAVIATGSNSTAVHFHNYFGKYPHIIRQNRNSVAILDGNETPEQLEKLGNDLFDYFGLGCRNVTKLYMPVDFDLDRIFNGIFSFQSIATHNKYANNYDYNKAVWLLNNEDLLENGFVIFKEDKNIASPVASVFYERYENKEALLQHLENHADQIQCIVGNEFIPFGNSQCPALTDYADNVNTLEFLISLNV
jgi:hypothetical protein